jgi:hypothetical protein
VLGEVLGTEGKQRYTEDLVGYPLFTVLKRCSTCGSPLDGFPVKKGEIRQGKPQDRTFRCSLFTVHCSLFTVHCSLFTVPCSLFPILKGL